jgi:hypothetical protein
VRLTPEELRAFIKQTCHGSRRARKKNQPSGVPMITESVRRYIRDETVDFHLVAVKDPLSSGLDGPRRLMQAVATKAGGLMPALASLNKKRQPFSVDAVENLLAAAPP